MTEIMSSPGRGDLPPGAAAPDGGGLQVFIPGEVVDLCVPTLDRPILERWAGWFNRPEVTAMLSQGLLPNTTLDQEAFVKAALTARDRLMVLIRTKDEQSVIGVASLSAINHVQKQCDMAIVVGERTSERGWPFFALEAKCRLTEHAFEVLGMERVNSGQVVDLIRWQRWQILFGYQIEGVLRAKFRKGFRTHDVIVSSCLLEDYLKIKALRGGEFWPGKAALLPLLSRLPQTSLLDETREWLSRRQAEYWDEVTFVLGPPDETSET